MKKGIILSLICLFIVCGCGQVPKLQDGKEAVITFKKDKKEHKISAEDLYNELKSKFGLQATIDMIDSYILKEEFKDYIKTAEDTAKSYIDPYIEQYGEEGFLQMIQQQSSYSSIDAYKNSLFLSIMQNHAMEEYAKTLITDKEINKYYEDEVKGDVEVYQILIMSKAKDTMTEKEIEEAEKTAKNTANDIIKKLNASKDKNKLNYFKELVKEYSEDETSKKKDGSLGYINYSDLGANYDAILDEAYNIKNNEYSKKVIETELGYHVIYRTNIKEKDKLEDVKEDIISTLVQNKLTTIPTISVDSMKYWRELYNLNIVDSDIDKQYGLYMNDLSNSAINGN